MRATAAVDPERCCASGGCVSVAPEHFRIGDGGHAEAIRAAETAPEVALLHEAADICPYAAISVAAEAPDP